MAQKILLVEDDTLTRELFQKLLEDEGYEVVLAEGGKQGLKLALRGGYDLILLDIVMPDMDGIVLLEELQRNPPQKENKQIVMLTIVDKEEIAKKALKTGAKGYLVKQFLTPEQALQEIKGYLAAT